jgi:hypothetical protein
MAAATGILVFGALESRFRTLNFSFFAFFKQGETMHKPAR